MWYDFYVYLLHPVYCFFFFLNDPPPPEISPLSLHVALPISAALLFPVDWPEPFGLSMIEAMACGTPVLAFRCGSVPEIVDHEAATEGEDRRAAGHRLDQDRKSTRLNSSHGYHSYAVLCFKKKTAAPALRPAALKSLQADLRAYHRCDGRGVEWFPPFVQSGGDSHRDRIYSLVTLAADP